MDIENALAQVQANKTREEVGGALFRAATIDPDQHAQDLTLSKQTGMPVDAVAEDRSTAQQEAKKLSPVDIAKIIDDTPEAAEFWKNHAPLASDDFSVAARWKKNINDLPESILDSKDMQRVIELNDLEMSGKLSPIEQIELDVLNKSMRNAPQRGTGSFLSEGVQGIAGNSIQMGRTIGAGGIGAVLGGAAGGAVGAVASVPTGETAAPVLVPTFARIGARIGGGAGAAIENYKQQSRLINNDMLQIRDENGQPLDRDIRIGASVVAGVANAGLDTIGLGKVLDNFPGFQKIKGQLTRDGIKQVMQQPAMRQAFMQVGKRLATGVIVEGTTEGMQQVNQILAEEFSKTMTDGQFKGKTLDEALGEVAESFKGGAAMATIIGGAGAAHGSYNAYRAPRTTPEQTFEHVAKINEAVRGDKLYQRSPEAFKNLMDNLAGEDKFYVGSQAAIDTITAMPQEQQDALYNAIPQLRDELETAIESGGDVAIKKADYATYIAPYPQADALAEHIKLDPEDTSVAERRSIQEALTANPELGNPYIPPQAKLSEADNAQIRRMTEVINQARKAAGFKETAKEEASFFARKEYLDSKALGLDPLEQLQKRFLQFQAVDEAGNTIQQGNVTDSFIDMLSRVDEVDKKGKSRFDDATRGSLKKFQARMEAAGITPEQAKQMGGRAVFDQLYPEPQRVQVGDTEVTLAQIDIVEGADGQLGFQVDDTTQERGEVEQLLNQAAYHGSPFIFDQFTLDHIGKGEGAQAYGWGLYFASNKKIAEWYRDTLSEEILQRPDGSAFDPSTSLKNPNLRATFRKTKFDIDATIERANQLMQSLDSETQGHQFAKEDAKVLQELKDAGGVTQGKGRVYTVEIPEDDVMLHWEKPLSEQTDFVKSGLQPLYIQLKKSFPSFNEETATGAAFYQMYKSHRGGDARTASLALNEQGIKGIKYLDAGSRTANTYGRSHNYVVFDDTAIQMLDSLEQEGERGSITIQKAAKMIRKVTVEFTKNSNFSTGVHEFSHWAVATDREYVQLARQRVDEGTATPQIENIIKRWEALKEAVGATTDNFNVEQEEKVARWFEGYMRDGKAPSESLRATFARYRDRLLAIYKDITGQGMDVPASVSAVFDRWLASEQEIEAVRSKHSALGELAASLNLEGEVAARLNNYIDGVKSVAEDKLYREMEREQRRQESKAYKEEFEKERVKVEAELRQKREYNLLDYMQKNGLSFIAGPETTGLPEDMVSNATGESVVHPDVVADLFGYDTGKQMLTALRATPQFDGAVNRETRTRLRAQFPNMIEDGRIHSEAISAIMNDKTLLALDLMVKEIGKAKGSANKDGIKLYAKAVAQEQTRKMLAKDAGQGYRFDIAREKAMREALKASRQGKPDEAIRHLYNAMVNQMIFKNLEAFSELKDRAETLFKKVTDGDKELAKRADMDFIGAARYILHKYGLGGEDFDAQQWLADVKEKDPLLQQDLAGAIDAIEAPRKPAKELSISEYRQIHNAIKNIYAAARGLKEFEREEKKFQTEQAVQEMIESLAKHDQVKLQSSTQLTGLNKFRRELLSIKGALRRIELWTEAMDGDKDGVFKKYLWNPINKAENEYVSARRTWLKGYNDILKKYKDHLTQEGKIDSGMVRSDALGRTAPLIWQDRLEMIGFLLHTGNQSNLDKLVGGYGISMESFRAAMSKLEDDGVITRKDWLLVQELWDYVEALKPLSQKAHRTLYGYRFEEIEPTPVKTKDGTFRGGYWPAIPDADAVNDAREIDEIVSDTSRYMHATVNKGMLKSRVEQYKAPLKTDLRLGSQHIDKMLRFIHLETAARQVASVLNNRDFRENLAAVDPEAYSSMLVPWLQRFAAQSTEPNNAAGDRSAQNGRKMLNATRSAAMRQLMLYNPVVAIQNIANMPIVGQLVGYRSVARAFAKVTMNPSLIRHVEAASKMMEERNTIESLKISQELNQIAGRKGGFAKGRDFMVRHGTIFMRVLDMYLSTVTWQAGYDNAIKEGKTDQQAIEAADSVVRKAQGARGSKDVAKVEATHPAVQLLMPFYGYFNSQLNLQQTEFGNIMRKYGWAGTPKMFMAYFSLILAPALLGQFIVDGLRRKLPDDDDEDGSVLDDWLAWATTSQLRYLAAEIPIVGQGANAAVNAFNKNPMDDRLSISPAVSLIETSLRTGKNVGKALSGDEFDESRMVQDALMTLGFATGLPLGQFGKPAGYLANINEGDEPPPSNIIDFGGGLIAGPKPKGK